MDLRGLFDNAQLAVLQRLQRAHQEDTAALEAQLKRLKQERDTLGQSLQNMLVTMEEFHLDFNQCDECGVWTGEALCAFPCGACSYGCCEDCWKEVQHKAAAGAGDACPACGEPREGE